MWYNPHMRLKQDNSLIYAFFMGNFIYGLGFSIMGWWDGVNQSSLFQSMHHVDPWLPRVWGTVLVAAVVLSVVPLHGKALKQVGSTVATLAWLYATLVYALTGYWLVFFSVGLLYLTFWVFYHFKFTRS